MEKKYSFQGIDTKLYLALRAMSAEMVGFHNSGEIVLSEDDPVLLNAKAAMEEFELNQGPLPDWAILRNWANEPVPGSQLYTKDGRRSGNAHIVSIEDSELHGQLYHCITDAGSEVNLCFAELEEMFEVGDYISDVDDLLKRFKRPE